jgi:DNA-directed RNA polymerase subunit RPC12/RpoP
VTAAPAVPAATVSCTQCGGTLQPAEGQVFLTCPYCSSTVFVDKSRVVFHWAVACTFSADQAEAALRRWMAGNQTVKDLDRKARIVSRSFQYFPLWYFKHGAEQSEAVVLEPAAALSITELKRLQLPAGDLQKYDPALDDRAVSPDVTLATATQWLATRGIPEERLRERALVHVPLYTIKYDFSGQSYTALVDGAAGQVFANVFPAKFEMPYLTIGGLAFLIYFVISWIPVAFGAAVGIPLYLVLAVVAAAPLFLAALWISAKV